MKRRNKLILGGSILILLLLGVFSQGAAEAKRSSAQDLENPIETWKSGITVEADPAYLNVQGRLLSTSASFRSDQAAQDVYYLFPAPATARTIQTASYLVVDRSGSYPALATFSLEIFALDGTYLRSVTTSSIDAQTTDMGTWNLMTLSTHPEDLVIQPGEFLAVHFSLEDIPYGNLLVRPIFEIQVK